MAGLFFFIMSEELLKLENIYKNFGNVKVLKDVNMNIKTVSYTHLTLPTKA